jgi:hypothetical protein
MLNSAKNPERRKFIAAIVGVFSTFVLGTRAEGVAKPHKKGKKTGENKPAEVNALPKANNSYHIDPIDLSYSKCKSDSNRQCQP